jgi:hypothetical protein
MEKQQSQQDGEKRPDGQGPVFVPPAISNPPPRERPTGSGVAGGLVAVLLLGAIWGGRWWIAEKKRERDAAAAQMLQRLKWQPEQRQVSLEGPQRWKSIHHGMHFNEVVRLLGRPHAAAEIQFGWVVAVWRGDPFGMMTLTVRFVNGRVSSIVKKIHGNISHQ